MLAVAVGLTVAMAGSPGWAENGNSPEIMQELQTLKTQNNKLNARINRLEQKISEAEETQARDEGAMGGTDSPLAQLNDKISLSGLIEVEAASAETFDDTDSSDISLATVELSLDAAISEWSSGHILLKYEDGASLDVDEGTITIGNTDQYPLYLTVGKMYVPFGDFTSNMISDPLTLELGETNEDALLVGFDREGFYGSVYVFNGDVEETGKDDMVRTMGANLGFSYEKEDINLDTGIGWISNIGDSDGLTDGLNLGAENDMDGQVRGFTAHLIYNHGQYGLITEYLQACKSFNATELAFNGQGAKPKAWNLELSQTTEIKGRETTFAVAYQGTKEAVDLGLPESRYLGSVSFNLMNYTSLSLEYIRDKDYATNDGGTGNNAQALTMQLAVEF